MFGCHLGSQTLCIGDDIIRGEALQVFSCCVVRCLVFLCVLGLFLTCIPQPFSEWQLSGSFLKNAKIRKSLSTLHLEETNQFFAALFIYQLYLCHPYLSAAVD